MSKRNELSPIERSCAGSPLRCVVVRGLAKEVEDELNAFLAREAPGVVHLAQSESGNHVTVTLLYTAGDR